MNLWVEGEIVRSATGDHSAVMKELGFDISSYKGKPAYVEIVDRKINLWGHINVDNIVQSDEPAALVVDTVNPTAPALSTVHTPEGIKSGTLTVVDGKFLLDEQPLDFDQVICAVGHPRSEAHLQSQWVEFANGDRLNATFRLNDGGKLQLESPLVGKHEVDVVNVAWLEFIRSPDTASLKRTGYLYRDEGDPIPGQLVKVHGNSVSFDCPLGVLELPRQGLIRYGFARDEKPAAQALDQIGLVDGSTLQGAATIEGADLKVEHPVLKSISVPWPSVRYLNRSREDVIWLSQVQNVETELRGAPFPPRPPHAVENGVWKNVQLLSAIRLGAETDARYSLPENGKKRTFRTVLGPVSGARGDVVVGFDVSGKSVYHQTLSAKAEPVKLSLDLPEGEAFNIHVIFGKKLAYPCGVFMGDAYVLMR